MLSRIKNIFKEKPQQKGFCDDDWHLDILLMEHEKALLSSDFPLELEIVEWISGKRSRIDRDYVDISWVVEGEGTERGGLFIAFINKGLFHEVFKGVGKEPEELCRRRVSITLQRHDDPGDQKSHPEWNCWLEVIDCKFICWEPETEEEKAKWR